MTVFVILKQTLFYLVVKLWQPVIHDWFSDTRQVLKWCLGSTAVGAQYGAVSALSFNRDCSRLLCGFAKGQVSKKEFCDYRNKFLHTWSYVTISFPSICNFLCYTVCVCVNVCVFISRSPCGIWQMASWSEQSLMLIHLELPCFMSK